MAGKDKSSGKGGFGSRLAVFFKGFGQVSSHAGGCGYIAPRTLGKSPVRTENGCSVDTDRDGSGTENDNPSCADSSGAPFPHFSGNPCDER